MEEKIYYKVVAQFKHTSLESIWRSCSSRISASYCVGVTTQRSSKKVGPLAVFSSEKLAREFLAWLNKNRFCNYAIFSCTIERAEENYTDVLENYWTGTNAIPEGTVFADSVTLLKKLEN